MSGQEIIAILLGLFFGYLLVSKLFGSGAPKSGLGKSPNDRPQQETGRGEGRPHDEATNQGGQEQPRSWYEVLNVPADSSTEEIRQAYKILVSKYHPDKVASMGPELKSICEMKSKEINRAFDEAMKLREARQ